MRPGLPDAAGVAGDAEPDGPLWVAGDGIDGEDAEVDAVPDELLWAAWDEVDGDDPAVDPPCAPPPPVYALAPPPPAPTHEQGSQFRLSVETHLGSRWLRSADE